MMEFLLINNFFHHSFPSISGLPYPSTIHRPSASPSAAELSTSSSQEPPLKLYLHSPVGAERTEYGWPIISNSNNKDKCNGVFEILETIKWVCEDIPELRPALEKHFSDMEFDPKSYESVKAVCDKYNLIVDVCSKMRTGTPSLPSRIQKPPSTGLLRHIIQKTYNYAISEPDKLNQYEPFSPEVYGETSFDFIDQMINEVEMNEDDVFIDLGSGVGQVILQMAAASRCKKCIGIEKADIPAKFAEAMDKRFRFWMKWHGKKHGEYELIKGDFFDEKFKELIDNATILFVNNYAFGPAVDHRLKQTFADLRDGAKIVSSKSFCSLNFRITHRTLSDIGAIMHVREIQAKKLSVSWTNKPVSYYLHLIDRTKLEHYFESLKHPDKKVSDTTSQFGMFSFILT